MIKKNTIKLEWIIKAQTLMKTNKKKIKHMK